MTSTLPEDPYKALGVPKDAQLPEIRSAHRKLVLKCHPDKVQDAALKAIKQDEFQKVQQAYELLIDDTRRTQYDESVKLMDIRNELRKEMGKANGGSYGPPPGRTVFDYEVRSAEPRPSTFKSKPKEPTNVYSRPPPRSFEDDLPSRMYDEPLRSTPRKTQSSEDRKRSAKDEERRKKSDDDRERERREKDAKRSAHSSAKKSRDKERKKGSEDKQHRTVYMEDDDSDEVTYRSPKPEKKSSRRIEEEIRTREEQARAAEKLREDPAETDRTRKLNKNKDYAAQYMQAARQKVEPEADFGRQPLRRAETFQEPSYSTRYVVPPAPYVTVDGDEYPRRSSAHPIPRRASHDIPVRSRESTSSFRDRDVSGTYGPDPVIVDAAPPLSMKPSLKSHSSAPPIVQESSRKEPGRSKTMQAQYSRSPPSTPQLSRASTFQAGDKPKTKLKAGGSKLKTTTYASDESDSEGPTYASPRSPSPPSRRREPEETRYKVDNGRSVLQPRHRAALREDDYEDSHDRSVSPRGGRRSFERPPLSRSGGSSSRTSSYRSPPYIPQSSSPEPIIVTPRPKMPHRDSHTRSSSGSNPYLGEVRYAQNYGPEHVTYAPEAFYRRGSDPTGHRDYGYPGPRPSRETAYA